MVHENKKLSKLKKIISGMDSCLVSFSGGVDSSFLLKVASGVLRKRKVLAVTAVSATYPKEELLFARKLANNLGVRHKIIRTYETHNKKFLLNPVNRCYFCKKELFSTLQSIARNNRINFVVDGSNMSDKRDFRPGVKAKKEFNIRSPLGEAGFSKEDIRRMSKKMGLITWDKPSLACLASRIPYGIKITPELLEVVDKSEKILRGIGCRQSRVRHHGELCRIEVDRVDMPKVLKKRDLIIEKLQKLGYNYITLDLEGYRTGSLNPHAEGALRNG